MLHASTRKLIDRLSEMTELGKLDWTQSEDGNLAYATEGYSVSLTEAPNQVIITSKDGKELERATADEIAATEQEDGTSYTTVVAAMTKEAARIARGTETAISTLLAGMEETPDADLIDTEAELTDGDETLQEDLGDDTAIIAADSIETVAEEETPSEEAQETAAPEEVAAAQEQTDEPAVEAEAETETETELEATETSESETLEASEEIEAEPVAFETTDTTDEDASEVDSAEDDDAAVVFTEASVSEDAESSIEATQENPWDTASEDTQVDDQPDDKTTSFETETELEAASEDVAETTDIEASDDASVESETDVTEAVARMADEVKSREENGLETAAASAVGAVALAAGLTPQEPEREETLEAATDTFEAETDDTLSETIVADVAAPPAYVPFGLSEADDDDAPSVVAEVETDPQPEWVAQADETPEIEITPEADNIESPMETLEQMTEDTFATRSEPSSIEAPAFTIAATTAEPETIDATVTAAAEPFATEQTSEPEPFTADAFAPVEAEEISEPELATVGASVAPEAPAAESYSLSGIGAGFGLGALSAKTEASGIPGPSTASVEPGEKVVIDATDDVLPKLEGNLNVSLAETASAAVSSANASNEASAPAEEEAVESESDILKPRTRFNPWD